MFRRQFLAKAFWSTTSLLIAKKSLADSFNMIEKCDCLVIGAGMAGITAAKELSFPRNSRNRFKTIVLEASQRIGGRIHSIPDKRFGGIIELGAEYLHRKPGSVALWNEVDMYRPAMTKIPRMKNGLMYYDGWENHLRKQYQLAFEWNLYDLLTFTRKIKRYEGPDISAKQWLDQQNYSKFGHNLLDLFFTGHVPGHLDEISLKGFASDRIAEQNMEGKEYGFVNGYSNFVKEMSHGLKQYHGQTLDIRFGAFVNYIKYGNNHVEVRTRDGRIFIAKTVILTASVGMLKSDEIVFDPPLPREKEDALHCLSMGDEAKIALKFKKRFWPEDAVFFNRIDSHHEMARTYFVPFSPYEEKNVVLTALFAGAEADKIKNMHDTEVIKALCRDFDRMFPDAAPTYELLVFHEPQEPIYLRQQWSRDPYAKGADSFLRVGAERSVPVTKARSILSYSGSTPGLFWAGEATVHSGYSQPCSTHGAHFSGLRAAREVAHSLRARLQS
ncbi:MAG: flavin monoamine oxidase family protein [Pseudobdellovibrionaceae bacterium]